MRFLARVQAPIRVSEGWFVGMVSGAATSAGDGTAHRMRLPAEGSGNLVDAGALGQLQHGDQLRLLAVGALLR